MNALPSAKATSPGALVLKQIVVAVDLSTHSEVTARYALGIAESFGSSVVLVHVYQVAQANTFITERWYRVAEHQQRDAQEALARLTETLRKTYPACEGRLLVGNPAEKVASAAADLGADLIITASHHPSFLARLLYLDQAPQIMHSAPCPVLVYHENQPAMFAHPGTGAAAQTVGAEREATRKRLLVPVDLADEPGPALDFAVQWALEWDADLYVLHVYSAPAYPVGVRYLYALHGVDWRRRQLESKLLDWVDALQKRHPRTFALFEDGESPAERIREAAGQLHVDLIFLSTHDRAWLSKWLLYSDADAVARKAITPVLVFRAKQDRRTLTLQS